MFGCDVKNLWRLLEEEQLEERKRLDDAARWLRGTVVSFEKDEYGKNDLIRLENQGRDGIDIEHVPSSLEKEKIYTAAPTMYLALRLVQIWFRAAAEGTLDSMIEDLDYGDPRGAVEGTNDFLLEDGDYRCHGCDILLPYTTLDPIENFSMRVRVDSRVPAGQCPECGGLCYQVSGPEAAPKMAR